MISLFSFLHPAVLLCASKSHRGLSRHQTFGAGAVRNVFVFFSEACSETSDAKNDRPPCNIFSQVKLFHMAKPVNPSIPPPAVDDAGEEDASRQPGLALLGLFGVESPPLSAAASSASPLLSTPVSSSTTSHAAVGAATPNGGSQFRPAVASAQQTSEGQGGGGGGDGSSSFSSGGDSTGAEGAGTGRAAGGSKLFKGFEKTETVVRRKKQVAPPPPPPGTPPPLPPPDEGAHLAHR